MELKDLLRVTLRRWWIIAIPALAALAYASYGYIVNPPPITFSGQMRFTAAVPPEDIESYEDGALAPWTSSEYVVNALADWVRTGSFAEEVSSTLGAQDRDVAAGAVHSAISADNERSVLVIYLNGSDPETLHAIAVAATTVLETRSMDYFPQLTNGVEVTALDSPVIGPVPPPLTARVEPLIRLGLGLAAGIGLAFLVEYLDPTIRERREVEALGVTVLAEVPSVRGKR